MTPFSLVPLFVAALAFADPRQVADAKIGVLLASALAGALGFAFLRARRSRDPGRSGRLADPPIAP